MEEEEEEEEEKEEMEEQEDRDCSDFSFVCKMVGRSCDEEEDVEGDDARCQNQHLE